MLHLRFRANRSGARRGCGTIEATPSRGANSSKRCKKEQSDNTWFRYIGGRSRASGVKNTETRTPNVVICLVDHIIPIAVGRQVDARLTERISPHDIVSGIHDAVTAVVASV